MLYCYVNTTPCFSMLFWQHLQTLQLPPSIPINLLEQQPACGISSIFDHVKVQTIPLTALCKHVLTFFLIPGSNRCDPLSCGSENRAAVTGLCLAGDPSAAADSPTVGSDPGLSPGEPAGETGRQARPRGLQCNVAVIRTALSPRQTGLLLSLLLRR